MFDIVFAGSEEEKNTFWKKAEELGFDGIIFIENYKDNKKAEAVLIKTEDVNELIKSAAKAGKEKKIVFVQGSNDEINRTAVENKNVRVLLSPEHSRGKDFMHYRNSGLNQVLCGLAAKNNIAIGVNLSEFSCMKDNREKALVLGRIMQNIRLCNKFKVKMFIASFAKKPDEMVSADGLKSFALSIGMSTSQTKKIFADF